VLASKMPPELEQAIRDSVDALQRQTGAERFALRSSAIGEDMHISFAGQYRSLLNVSGNDVVERYREVLAGKFTPKAIYYQLSHAFRESELAMCVGCIPMVDAAASGVVYTRNPVRPTDDCLLVNSIFGLGQLLVDGTLTPDIFRVSRETGRLVESQLAPKAIRLVMRDGSGTETEAVPEAQRLAASIDVDRLHELARMALRIEEHYEAPQDIEWALDGDGRLALLQARPLKLVEARPAGEEPDLSGMEAILFGGTTVCPGAGSGPVHRAASSADLGDAPDGCVLVTPHPFPGLFAVLSRLTALVTEVGGVASHMATLAREYGIPTIMGAEEASRIPLGEVVTVDATNAVVYAGAQTQVVEARRLERAQLNDDELLALLKRALGWITPLNLLHPADPSFVIENCVTLHDITRFCHQKAMHEMLEGASGLGRRESVGLRLQSEIPLPVKVVYLDQDPADYQGRRWIGEDDIQSQPMRALWSGMKDVGWPLLGPEKREQALKVQRHSRRFSTRQFAEDSYAILSREYMITSLRMGYHFNTIEAMCSDEPNKNFVGLQYKHGGAALDRRLRRLRLLTRILERMGFENSSKGDFLDSRVAYLSCRDILDKLRLLGRLIILTKQLDMALSNDSITDWYTRDIMQKLGLGEGRREGSAAADRCDSCGPRDTEQHK
jgi:pyruvate,water dikinase